MMLENKFILTATELKEMLMRAWVDGWQNDGTNDNGKREYSTKVIEELNRGK